MTRRQKFVAAAALAVLGCSGATAVYLTQRKASHSAARDGAAAPGASEGGRGDLECVAQVSLGGGHTCVLFRNGRVHCYGDFMVAGTGSMDAEPDRDPVKTEARFSAIAAGSHREVCALAKPDGSIWCWGDGPGRMFRQGDALFPVRFSSVGTDNQALGVGTDRVCALKRDSSVWCLGWSALPDTPAERALDGVSELFVRNYFACAKMKSGGVQCWGSNTAGELGRGSVSDANVGVWSEPPAPVLGIGPELVTLRLSAITACGLTRGNAVWCWGAADYSRFADGRYWDGTGSGLDFAQSTPVLLTLPMKIKDIVLGTATLCALAVDGSVHCWGAASYNEMLGKPSLEVKHGDAVVPLEPRPRRLEALGDDNRRIYAGGSHYCVEKNDGSLWCWGNNGRRQIDRKQRTETADLTRLRVECAPD